MSEVILTKEQRAEALAARVSAFSAGLKELLAKHRLGLRPRITPDGPIISIVEADEESPKREEAVLPLSEDDK